ncbi:MAG: NHL repeat-containing protein [Desulfomonilaceae bacterium]|jgi:sugar lactone lactonase YvrE
MKRRDFIKSIGAAAAISVLSHGTSNAFSHKNGTNSPPYYEIQDSVPHTPFCIIFNSTGNLVVTDPSLYRIFLLDYDLKVINSFGKPGSAPGAFNFPKGVAVDSKNFVYVVDSNNCRIQIFDPEGKLYKVVGSIGSIAGMFATPQGICLDSKDRMFVADTRNHRIQVFESFELVSVIGDLGDGDSQFRLPTASQVTPSGEIMVLDSKHGLVKVFDKDGNFERSFAGEGNETGRLNSPQGMILDHDGSLLVADTGNHRLQKFDSIGKPMDFPTVDSNGDLLFKTPTSLAVRNENLYVADSGKGAVIKLGLKNL